MKSTPCRSARLFRALRRASLLAFLCASAVARAHPGHDDHDFAWDFAHLTEHPLATLLCLAVVGGVATAGWRLLRRAAASDQSLRGSQASRGK